MQVSGGQHGCENDNAKHRYDAIISDFVILQLSREKTGFAWFTPRKLALFKHLDNAATMRQPHCTRIFFWNVSERGSRVFHQNPHHPASPRGKNASSTAFVPRVGSCFLSCSTILIHHNFPALTLSAPPLSHSPVCHHEAFGRHEKTLHGHIPLPGFGD